MTFKEFKDTVMYKNYKKRTYTINGDEKETYLIENIMDKNHMLDDTIVIGTGFRGDIIDIDLVMQ